MNFYYAVFQIEDCNTLVSIPDVEICETFGKTWDEAYEMGVDALAACLSEPETIVHPKSSRGYLQKLYPGAEIVPIPVDEVLKKRYQKTRRINISFPEGLLIKVDEFRSKEGMKRSQLLAQAAEEYLESRI
jgi:predicted RNase H-like HicB family nuclease